MLRKEGSITIVILFIRIALQSSIYAIKNILRITMSSLLKILKKKNEYAWHGQKSKTNNVDNEKGDDTRRNATTNKKDVHSSSAISRDAQDASRNIHVVR